MELTVVFDRLQHGRIGADMIQLGFSGTPENGSLVPVFMTVLAFGANK